MFNFLWRFVERCSIFYHIYAHQVRQTSCLVSCDLFKDPVFFIEGLSNMFSLLSVALVPSTRPMIWSVCVWGGGILQYICYTGTCRPLGYGF